MAHDGGSLSVRPGEGETIEGPVGGPLTFKARGERTGGALTVLENTVAPLEGAAGLERFFDRFARLPEGASIPDAFREIGEVGMQVLGPPLAVSDPIGQGTAPVESADGSMPAVEG